MGSIRGLRSWRMVVPILTTIVAADPASAHNASVHQRMTDFAYHVLLAAERLNQGPISPQLKLRLELVARNAAGAAFLADAAKAAPKLRALKSGLPDDLTLCLWPFAFGGGPPDWQLPPGTALKDLPMRELRLAVTQDFGHAHATTNCAIDLGYRPSGVLATVNPVLATVNPAPPNPGLTIRDNTGTTLGYWAAEPDQHFKDWVFRSTTLETIQNPAVVDTVGAGVTVAVSCACVLGCGFFPFACALCPVEAVGAGGSVIDKIDSIDADSIYGSDYVGLGHFIDMKPVPAGPPFFDTMPAKLMERAGPAGVPDDTELLVIAASDLAGLHVNHDEAEAPAKYEILASDFHPNTTLRNKSAWETPTIGHLQFTPVDNLAMFGFQRTTSPFVKGTSDEPFHLGWPLHALGDAAVPMHVVGASGYGHRPYEDLVEATYELLVGVTDGESTDTVIDVVGRALKWRKFIQDFRALHVTTAVPVRDLVTALAATTLAKAMAQPSVFQPGPSLLYAVNSAAGNAAYEDVPAIMALQRDLLIEGIAAECAFLLSYTEVAP